MHPKLAGVVLVATLLVGCAQQPSFQPFTSEAGQFRILMPGTPTTKDQTQPTPAGPITIHSVVKDLGKVAYIVSYFDSPIQQEERTDDQILDDARGGAIANVQGTLIAERPVSVKGYAGRAFEFTLPPQGGAEGMGKARMYVVGKRLYILQAIGVKARVNTESSDKFLGSFQLLDSVPEAEPKSIAGRDASDAGGPAAGAAPAWTEFSSPTGRFAILMPETPKEQVQEDKTPNGPSGQSHLFEVGVRSSGARRYLLPTSYAVIYEDLPGPIAANNAATFFDTLQRTVAGNVQGQVARHQDTTLDGFPGREVTIQIPASIIPGGAVLQDRMYVVNDRLYQVMVQIPAGNDSDAAKFFNSFRLLDSAPAPGGGAAAPAPGQSPPNAWKALSPAEGRFTAQMPGEPDEQSEEGHLADGTAYQMHSFQVATPGSATYVVSYKDLNGPAPADARAVLDSVGASFVQETQGRQARQRDRKLNGYPGRELTIEVPAGNDAGAATIVTRIYVVNNRIYQLIVQTPQGARNQALKFFNSFHLVDTPPATGGDAPGAGPGVRKAIPSPAARLPRRSPRMPLPRSRRPGR